MSGKKNRRRDAIAVTLSAALHILFISFVINESATPYSLPQVQPPPLELQIYPPQEVPPPPPPPVVIPPKIKQALEKQTPPPPPPLPPKPTPPKPQATPPTPIAPPKPTPPKPSPPRPAPPTQATPTPARPAPAKPISIPAAPAPAKAPAPPSALPSPSPGPKPAPRPAPVATVIAPSSVTAHTPSPQVVLRPSHLNLHKTNHEVPANVPTLPMAPSGGGARTAGGGAPGGGAAGAPGGSRLSGLSPYPYGALPSGGPGLRGTLVGCANARAVNLSSVERARCNERFGEEAARAPVLDGIDPAKRARFDKTADKQERDRASTMPVGTTAGAQGFGGLGGAPN
ncbi:MAG: hypothetical protein ACREEB_16240 [Caulobacteraceae bacterium]